MKTQRLLAIVIVFFVCLAGYRIATAHGDEPHPPPTDTTGEPVQGAGVHAACPGGPTIDGITLDECITRTFLVGGVNKTIRVWYTKNATTATRTVDGSPVTLEHWITQDSQAQQVAAWFEEAWLRYFADSGHHLYDTGCGNLVNVQLEDGVGWSGIAYWGSPGNCWIGIDAPMVRNGGGQWTVYHEAQHYLQYSYDNGCYGFLQPNYPDDSEFVEGYADLGADSVNAALDIMGYSGITYDPSTSMYEKSYGNIFNKYFIEQLGTIGTPSDPWHRIDAMYDHYSECDNQDTLYVLSTLIPTLSGGKWTDREFFLNFFAANWAKDWADPVTQPELVYLDDDASPYGNLAPTTQDITMSGGSQSFADSTPDDWAARYYQVRPQTGCPYLQMEVDGSPGAQLGINLMAAKTSAPTRVLRSAKIGEDFVRTFAAAGVHNRLVAAVNSFNNNYSYTVKFTCVTPTVNILEPRQVNFAMVGDPASPIAFLARWTVSDGASTVRGLQASDFSFDAGGDPITLVPGTFQEVGNEYWAILMPPVKPAGTTFVNFKVTLNNSISDTETNALLYVNPGNSDIAMSFDASGSMNTEDTVGEGTRLTNAKRAGQVVADLLRVGDRLVVQDWSAFDNPPGCGLPFGTGNCPLDIRTLLPLTDLTAGNLSTVISQARTQINNISAREWTPVGEGIDAAKNALLAGAPNTNPKYIFLLSDGEENVRRLYADIRSGLIASGVVVNTIAFGPEAPGNLMAQIAADTGGIYRPVATGSTGSSVMAADADDLALLESLNLPVEASAVMAASFLPGHLGLANVYDYFDTEAEGASRVIHMSYTGVPAFDNPGSIKELSINIDPSVNQLRLVVSGKQPDDEGCTVSDIRKVDVFTPTMGPNDRWIPISPPLKGITPSDWDIRNNRFDDVLIVNNPAPGAWKFRTYYYPNNCIPLAAAAGDAVAEGDAAAATVDATAAPSDADAVSNGPPYAFLMNVSVHSTIQLEGQLLGLTANQGVAGDEVTIVGMLLDKNGTLPATAMLALVEGPAGNTLLVLKDDGASNDGAAGDNIYAARFSQTLYGGGYGVRILAAFKDPANPANTLIREWNGGFWINGPRPDLQRCGGPNDTDNDCMPDEWERRCKLIVGKDDRNEDPDRDGLTNYQELQHGTLPCRADTDNGGEKDGSEVNNNRDPLYPKDDKVLVLDKIRIRPLNSSLFIGWSRPISYTQMLAYISTTPDDPGQPIEMGQKGDFLLTGLQNDRTYYIRLQGLNDGAEGDLSDPIAVTPKADPDMPSGTFLIDNGAERTTNRQVTLYISATDTPLEGAAQGSAAHQTDLYSTLFNVVSGNVQMRFSNSMQGIQSAPWEPLAERKTWTLDCNPSEVCTVYAQFKDGAGNESLIVNDTIVLDLNRIFLPVINR
ncbi:choice-of-anchor X domain-containing protein [Caldilinea sp.]|uniref:vWA domain-containing protein n=1 Tax=Caldilinea sp. TaxID=2293560 RepID=UPI0021DC8943|nr:choice-of-anchor X domain-containing protein [Caldilinea sp.]GIV73494.1 MAG: hypothetical protein KatS3mg049_2050 [Caldilinea sp.]